MVKRAPIISTFDPGTIRMGWASGIGARLPTCGAWRFPFVGDDYGQMMDWIDVALHEHIERYRPDEIGYESPILLPHDKLQALCKTLSIGTHIAFVARRRGIACSRWSAKEGKESLAGNKSASKEDMVYSAIKLGVALPETKADGREDAADALGGWLVLLLRRCPSMTVKFDQALWSSRKSVLL